MGGDVGTKGMEMTECRSGGFFEDRNRYPGNIPGTRELKYDRGRTNWCCDKKTGSKVRQLTKTSLN